MGIGGIDEIERVLIVLVLEEIVDAFFFQQSIDEIEVAFAVLHAVLAQSIGFAQRLLDIAAETVLLENRLDDLGHGLILKDAAIGLACQKPQPRP